MKTPQTLLAHIEKLIAIESTAQNPEGLRAALDLVADFVRASGKAITIERFEQNGKPSFLAYREGKRPERFHIILNGHLDVVPGKPEQYRLREENGRLYGRGIYDMKAAAIVLAQVFCEYVDTVPYALGLQLVTDEEPGGFDGTLYQVKQGVRADFVICGECGRRPGTYQIANEHKGIAFLDIMLNGKSSHGAYPWEGENAALRAAQFMHKLHDVYPSPSEESQHTTATVTGIISMGDVHNKVPEHALIKLDCRFTNDDPNFLDEQALAQFIASIDPKAAIAACHVFCRPMYTDPDYFQLQALKAAAETVEGHAFSYARRHAGSDGRHYTPVGGQVCEFGIAGENQHGDNEHITYEAFETYLATMRHFLNTTENFAAHETLNTSIRAAI